MSQSLAQMFGKPLTKRCHGTDEYKLPQKSFPNGVQMTEYSLGERLIDISYRFLDQNCNCVAKRVYDDKNPSVVKCKHYDILQQERSTST